MKRKVLKDLLNEQLDSKTPKLSKKVTNTPLHSNNTCVANEPQREKRTRRNYFPKWAYGVACAVVICILTLSFGLYFGLPKGNDTIRPQTVCYVVDINPSIAVTADSDGKVMYLSSQNGEGDIVLASDIFDDYKSMSVEECINAIIEQSARLGYIDCFGRDNKVTITLVGDDKANKITVDALATKSQEFLRQLNVFAYVDTDIKDVKTFVDGKGWEYVGSKLDDYLNDIRLQSKYVCGAQYGGDFEYEAKNYISDYYKEILTKKNLLDKLGEKLDAIDSSGEITTTYWGYKLVEGTMFAPQLSDGTARAVKECDALIEELATLGVKASSTVEYTIAVAKYTVVEEITKLFEDIRDYIYDSSFYQLFLKLVDDDDVNKFQVLKEELDGYYRDVVTKLDRELSERTSQFLSKFESRQPIDKEEYDRYLAEYLV